MYYCRREKLQKVLLSYILLYSPSCGVEPIVLRITIFEIFVLELSDHCKYIVYQRHSLVFFLSKRILEDPWGGVGTVTILAF